MHSLFFFVREATLQRKNPCSRGNLSFFCSGSHAPAKKSMLPRKSLFFFSTGTSQKHPRKSQKHPRKSVNPTCVGVRHVFCYDHVFWCKYEHVYFHHSSVISVYECASFNSIHKGGKKTNQFQISYMRSSSARMQQRLRRLQSEKQCGAVFSSSSSSGLICRYDREDMTQSLRTRKLGR
jgi:hypothetical protein